VFVNDDSAVEGPVFAKEGVTDFSREGGCDLPLFHQSTHQLLRIDGLTLIRGLQTQDLLSIAVNVQSKDLFGGLYLMSRERRLDVRGGLAKWKGVETIDVALRCPRQANLDKSFLLGVFVKVGCTQGHFGEDS
jgi:hypothetical protein